MAARLVGRLFGPAVRNSSKYETFRGRATWGYSALVGFVPFNPGFWILQIPLFIVVVLVCIFVFGTGVGTSILIGYVSQALIAMVIVQWISSAVLSSTIGM